MKLLRYISVAIVMLSSLGAMAQSSIEAAIEALQKSKSVTNEIFSERRDPSTRAVIRSSRLFNFDDDKMAVKIQNAMKKERAKAVAFQMKTNGGAEVYSISFEDSKHLYTKYVLIRECRGGWILSIDKSLNHSSKDRSEWEPSDTIWFDPLPDREDFHRQISCFGDSHVIGPNIGGECSMTVIVANDGRFRNLRNLKWISR